MHTANPAQSATLRPFADSLAGRAALAVGASVFVALCAHVSIPLLFTPVPLTLGNMAVLLVGLMLGPGTACSALCLYLAEGALGLPVFSPTGPGGIAQLLGPTAGFLFSYPLAAAVTGLAASRIKQPLSRFAAAVVACLLGSVVIFAMGAGWLASLLHLSFAADMKLAVVPFLPGEALKIAAAAGIYAAFAHLRRDA